MTITWEDFVKFMDAFAIGASIAFSNQVIDVSFKADGDDADGFTEFCREGGAAMLDAMGVKIVHKEDE